MNDLLGGHAYLTKFSVGLEILIKSLPSHTPKVNLATRIIALIVHVGS